MNARAEWEAQLHPGEEWVDPALTLLTGPDFGKGTAQARRERWERRDMSDHPERHRWQEAKPRVLDFRPRDSQGRLIRPPAAPADRGPRECPPDCEACWSNVLPVVDDDALEPRPTVMLRASDLNRARVEWLWQGRIPHRMVTLIDGDPGVGKSTMTIDLAARVTMGDDMPDGMAGGAPMNVVLLSAEDDPEVTITPRLEAAGADRTRVWLLQGATDEHGNPTPPTVPDGIEFIRGAVRSVHAGLVIVDPLVAYLDAKIDTHRDQQVRRAMSAFKALAEQENCTVLLVRHLTKGSGGSKAMYRGGGSIGFNAHARAALLVAPHPDDAGLVVVAQTKLNVGEKRPSLAFRLTAWEEDPTWARVAWEGEVDLTADQVLEEPNERRTPRDTARDWLLDLLADGPSRADRIEKAAEYEGLKWATVRRARTELRNGGLIDRRKIDGTDPHW